MFTTNHPVPDNYAPSLLKFALDQLAAQKNPDERGPDEFPIFASDPLAAEHRAISHFMIGAKDKYKLGERKQFKSRDVNGADRMLDSDDAQRFRYLLAIVTRELWFWKHKLKATTLAGTKIKGWRIETDLQLFPLVPLAQALLRNLKGPVQYDGLIRMLDAITIPRVGQQLKEHAPLAKLMPIVIATVATEGVSDDMLAALQKLRKQTEVREWDWGAAARERRQISEQIDALLNPDVKTPEPSVVDPGEPWAGAVLAKLSGKSKTTKDWLALLKHAADSEASQPAQKWQKNAKHFVDAVGLEAFEQSMIEWFELMLKPREAPLTEAQLKQLSVPFNRESADVYSQRNEMVMKGLAWIAGTLDRPVLASALGSLAERCYKKIPQVGPRSPKVANACLVALTMMNGKEAAAQLSRLKAIVKQPTGRKMIERSLARLATRQNVTVDDLEEQTVPTFALVDGRTERKIGSTTLRIALTPLAEVEQSWESDGRPRKSPPSELKANHAAELKTIKRELADLDKTLSAQRLRVERLLLRRTPWKLDAWLAAYHDHALMRFLSRRLIWSFAKSDDTSSIAAAWDGKRFVDASDQVVKLDAKTTQVRLWHPSTASAAQVLAWRQWLERHEMTQPFKQAHREVYLLTDAERRSGTYSNRFAQHILRQHQFQALCQQRGWKYQLMGNFDFHNYPSIDVPLWNARVELWANIAEDGGISATGIATHLTTDQVRFLDPKSGEPVHLEDVPPLLLSEIFRDVDLFVGVASVGNDPAWNQAAREERHHTYWRQYISADLTETGQTRRQVLESLLPRLTKLAGKWNLADRYLIIRGSLRTYKIHLGSGNILMEPNDQYLCIVADHMNSRGHVFLPFEGDATLSIILSKAFLLADDRKITDETIIRQIQARAP